MAEQVISPGVFTRENDLSFLPQGIGAIGAAIVGPTEKGPAFIPTVITRGYNEYVARFGTSTTTKPSYVPMTVRNYLRNAGTVTVTRVLGGGGYRFPSTGDLQTIHVDNTMSVVLHPSKHADTLDLNKTTISYCCGGSSLVPNDAATKAKLKISGGNFTAETPVSISLNHSSNDYIGKTLGTSPENSKTGANAYLSQSAYCYILANQYMKAIAPGGDYLLATLPTHTFTSSYAEGYDHAMTPWIESGHTNAQGQTTPLFRFHTLADGDLTNTEYKISINGLKEPADIDGEEQYSTFNVMLRKFGDKDKAPRVVEQWTAVNLNPNSPNYIARVIGDRYAAWDNTLQKVLTYGNNSNKSQIIRVETDAAVEAGSVSPKLSPKGFACVSDTIYHGTYSLPPVVYRTQQNLTLPTSSGVYNKKAFLGWDFELNKDHIMWNKVIPETSKLNLAGKFSCDALNGHTDATWTGSLSASIDNTGAAGPKSHQVQFSVPFQGGFDGISPAKIRMTGQYLAANNMQGMNLQNTSATGYTAYKKALDILANQDEYDFNMLALPGVLNRLHSSVTDAAIAMVEERSDAFYVMDLAQETDSVSTAVSNASSLDSNYTAVYYPWVKVMDTSINKPIFVPPSVVVPGAIAQSDAASAEWFAPAGLNRGVLGMVMEAKMRLTQAERDTLYEGRINPIATFPRTGVCIWGQKTTQVRTTALDRINVRRLLIEVKKFIASSSKYLVFEQNTLQTRNRFLNIVNPYLESVQQRQGLYAFRVQMDEGNNTPDVIDRNQLVGAIYLQPTKTAEFIILDFNVLPTGATFDV